MGVIAKGILRGRQGLFTPVSLGYPLSVFNKNSTLNPRRERQSGRGHCETVTRAPRHTQASGDCGTPSEVP